MMERGSTQMAIVDGVLSRAHVKTSLEDRDALVTVLPFITSVIERVRFSEAIEEIEAAQKDHDDHARETRERGHG